MQETSNIARRIAYDYLVAGVCQICYTLMMMLRICVLVYEENSRRILIFVELEYYFKCIVNKI